ncbi:DUF1415 domain-containing protein [Paraglaciecola aquimarina]|uniref:DUF1415 domain-containing protein n=1 Tax=Paraglaciecola algarum TaxID=3050085 RepID=A0ABS9D281_9ALTE|nr:DUF1415 domain-containing protein [Paraglaciecola sp. G1-23]MCF2946560.1 DUF1415 domain-containing protein [Paraglaciecola sp. G1-23]
MHSEEDMPIIDSVKSWINKVIIGLNFCPFAKKEMQRETVHYCVCASEDIGQSLERLIEQFSFLDQHSELQTALLIFSQGFSRFDDYLDLVDYANGIIEQGGYAGVYQLATFHPDYCFDGEPEGDPANYTNRAPYPILHILRESSLEQVLQHYPNPENIPENNIKKARELGVEKLKALIKPNNS